jgi:hypothetical protein
MKGAGRMNNGTNSDGRPLFARAAFLFRTVSYAVSAVYAVPVVYAVSAVYAVPAVYAVSVAHAVPALQKQSRVTPSSRARFSFSVTA